MKATTSFVISLVGMSAAAAVLILLVPGFFGEDGQGHLGAALTCAVLTAVFAVGVVHWRPSRRTTDGR